MRAMYGWISLSALAIFPLANTRVISTHHYATQVAGLKLGNGEVDGLEEAASQTLAQESIQVQRATEQLHMPLLQDRHITIRRWVGELVRNTLCPELLVQNNTTSYKDKRRKRTMQRRGERENNIQKQVQH